MRLAAGTRLRTRLLAAAAACATASIPVLASSAHADDSTVPTVHPTLFAAAPPNTSKPDDITILDNTLYVTYQNNAGKDGSPPGSMSTIVAFDRATSHVVATYSVTGRCDGLTADPAHGRLFASVNEDLNSSLFVITPGSATPVVHYTYSPDPAQTGSDGTNGGTDALSVAPDGTVYVAHSNPDPSLPSPNNTAAVHTLTLSGTTAHLTPFFGVNDEAHVINPSAGAPETAPLALTDPDSNRFIPGRRGGTLIQDAQADSKLVFATNVRSDSPRLRQLNLTNAVAPSGGPATPQLDDIARIGHAGVLYLVDQLNGGIFTIDTSSVEPGTLFVSQPKPSTGDLPNDPALGVVNPRTGVVTHVASTFGSPKGLLFVPNHGRPEDDQGDSSTANDQQLSG
jgi:hypothetical protein